MIRFKKIFITTTCFLILLSCGYTPIFSKKYVNFSIEKIEFFGDRNSKEKIKNVLSEYTNKPEKEKKISLIIKNSINKTVASKNSKGEIQTNRISLNVNVKIILSENNIFNRNFSRTSTYSAIERKSEQKLIENKLIENLSNEIAQDIIVKILEITK